MAKNFKEKQLQFGNEAQVGNKNQFYFIDDYEKEQQIDRRESNNNTHIRNSISKKIKTSEDITNINEISKKRYKIKKPLNNFEIKSKYKKRLYDEEKFRKGINKNQS